MHILYVNNIYITLLDNLIIKLILAALAKNGSFFHWDGKILSALTMNTI